MNNGTITQEQINKLVDVEARFDKVIAGLHSKPEFQEYLQNKCEQVNAEFEFHQTLAKHYHDPDHQAARILLAALAAHNLPGAPVWLMLVAPPSSMKTELLKPLDVLPGVYLIDEITPNTFISGQIVKKKGQVNSQLPASLLHRIGPSGVIAFADFSTVIEMRREDRGKVLAQMRRIYDGRLHREFGHVATDTKPDWEGRITFLTAVTPAIDRHYAIYQTLGERFLQVRMKGGDIEAAIRAMLQDDDQAVTDLKTTVKLLFDGVGESNPSIPQDILSMLAHLAKFAVRARTQVPRSGYTKQLDHSYQPEPEAPARMAKQLAQLTLGAAALEHRSAVGPWDYALAVRAALDSIPANRRKVLDALMTGVPVSELDMPESTVHYTLEDLELVKLVKDGRLNAEAQELISTFAL